jgi:hypothetical protein
MDTIKCKVGIVSSILEFKPRENNGQFPPYNYKKNNAMSKRIGKLMGI